MMAAANSFEKIGNQLDLFKSPETLIKLELGSAKETLEQFIADMRRDAAIIHFSNGCRIGKFVCRSSFTRATRRIN